MPVCRPLVNALSDRRNHREKIAIPNRNCTTPQRRERRHRRATHDNPETRKTEGATNVQQTDVRQLACRHVVMREVISPPITALKIVITIDKVNTFLNGDPLTARYNVITV